MALPKLLPEITITSSNNTFGYNLGGATSKNITANDYDTILEALANLDTQLGGTFTVALSASGIVTISNTSSWTVDWSATDDGLESLLGFTGSESVAHVGSDYILTATRRHLYGLYPPVGAQYPEDEIEIATREQETDDGKLSQLCSSAEHRRRTITFGLLSAAQLKDGGTDSDGAGGTAYWTSRTFLDFWRYVRNRPFRFYADRSLGTVASPGTAGTDYTTWRRYAEPWRPSQRDPGDYSFFDLSMRWKYVG